MEEERKIVLITGGSRGIGKETAKVYAENGYDVAINYVSDRTDVEGIKKEFQDMGVKCLMIKADVSNEEDVNNMAEKVISEFGKIDVLVNNAGITKDTLLMRMSKEDFDTVSGIPVLRKLPILGKLFE